MPGEEENETKKMKVAAIEGEGGLAQKRKVDWRKYDGHDDPREKYQFAQWPIERGEVFFWSPLSIAFTNLKPVLPGHVLVSPKRVVARFRDLTGEEVRDLFSSASLVAQLVLTRYRASSYNISLQDGRASGQTVAHVHLHVMPRFPDDFAKTREQQNRGKEEKKKENGKKDGGEDKGGEQQEKKETLGVDWEERKPRTRQDMIEEALDLRKLMAALAEQEEAKEAN